MEEGSLLHVYYTVLGWGGEGAAGAVCKWTMKSVINVYMGAAFTWNTVTVLKLQRLVGSQANPAP